MAGPITRFLEDDHRRLEALLRRAVADAGNIDMEAYAEFREGLLRHIGMEEKILLPEARRRRGGVPLDVARQLRRDHSAIGAMLVPTPTHALIAQLEQVLAEHNPLEEGPDGAYAACEALFGVEADLILERIRAAPRVPVARHFDGPRAHEQIAALLQARRTPG
jgi:hypothetical protein